MSDQHCRLLIDAPANGSWNMAVDAALLESAAESDTATLRFYRWSKPTLSLGYFQHLADRQQHATSADCDIVRRSTGGGAIVHDNELTYSLSIAQSAVGGLRSKTLYMQVHQALIAALAEFGVEAAFASESTVQPNSASPFLCFQRLTALDVVIGGEKIAGSAQRRSGRAVLQHGSVLLGRSSAAPELPGIVDLSSRSLGDTELLKAWSRHIEQQLGCNFSLDERTILEEVRAAEIESSRYAIPAWTNRK